MAIPATEDEDYLVSGAVDEFAIADEDALDNPDIDEEDTDQVINSQLFIEINKYLDEAITEHNSVDIIDLTQQAKMNPTQQIAVHKCVVQHLRAIKQMIKDKREES